MRVVLGWLAIVAVSLGLGVTLYATSLRDRTTGYQESVIPRPRPHGGGTQRQGRAHVRQDEEAPRAAGSGSSRPSPRDLHQAQQRYRVTTNPL